MSILEKSKKEIADMLNLSEYLNDEIRHNYYTKQHVFLRLI